MAIIAAVALSGCEQQKDDYTRKVAEDAQIKALEAGTQIDALKAQLKDVEERLVLLRKYIDEVDNGQSSLRKTFNHNVRLDNEAAAARMTERGACGREWRQSSDGQWFQTNKVCTVKDLKP